MVQQGNDSQIKKTHIVIVQCHTESINVHPALSMISRWVAPQTNCQVIAHMENFVIISSPPRWISSLFTLFGNAL